MEDKTAKNLKIAWAISWRWAIYIIAAMVWLHFLCGCTSMRGPAKQKRNNTPPRVQVAPIPIDQIDLNGDGKIDISEHQRLTEDKPGVLITFLCIGGATLFICLGTAWLSRNIPPANKPEKVEVEEESEDQIIEEDFDGVQKVEEGEEDWLDTGQDFEDGGKRR